MTSDVELPVLPHAPDLQGASVGQGVTEYIRHLILTGHFRAGDRPRVEHLAAQLRISVTTVREALVELLGEGFVERRPRRGYIVAELTRSGFEDRVLVLAMVTGELAARAARVMGPDLVASLTGLQTSLRKLDRSGSRDAAESVNHKFHCTINIAAASPELAWIAERFARYVPRYPGQSADSRPRSCSYDHASVLTALEGRALEAAREAKFSHLVESGKTLGDELAGLGLWAPVV
ncbi:GntR family transcriptional regulator [Streptomyces umbrinus]|uniref:GntR family transcriptional regulator n=1 Tax=Streptomyces umbrinus TaxID=67370 RepID=UPI003C307E55